MPPLLNLKHNHCHTLSPFKDSSKQTKHGNSSTKLKAQKMSTTLTLAKKLRFSSTIPSLINTFKVPGHMDDYEILSRGTAFPVQFQGETRWLTSRHVTHPQLHLNDYYANDDVDWLRDITSEMTKQHLEWRSNDGTSILNTAQVHRVRPHDDLDLAELTVEQNHATAVKGFTFLQESTTQGSIEENSKVFFFGHNLNVNIDAATGDDLGNMVPHHEKGASKVIAPNGFRVVCETETPLQMGMCGGPCLLNEEILGMTEGILPGPSSESFEFNVDTNKPQTIADVYPHHAIVLGNSKLIEFLQDV